MNSILITRKPISDLVGKTFNKLTVIQYNGKGKYNKHYWLCRCICGENIILPTYRITGKDANKSCGCLRVEKIKQNRFNGVKHGLSGHKLYAVFYGIHQRCKNPNNQRWKYYGEKGVKVCDQWEDFLAFYEWAINNGWEEGLSIDRINSNGDYEPENCRWVTISENTARSNERKR